MSARTKLRPALTVLPKTGYELYDTCNHFGLVPFRLKVVFLCLLVSGRLGKWVRKAWPGAFTRRLNELAEANRPVFFVQIGSHTGHSENDPLHKVVHEKHWRGLVVEPIESLFRELEASYKDVPGVTAANVAVSKENGVLQLRHIPTEYMAEHPELPPWASQLASTNPDHVKNHGLEAPVILTEAECVTPETLFDRYGISTCDVLHIDTEGHDHVILKAWDFDRLKPGIILFEGKHTDGTYKTGDRFIEIVELLMREGYAVQMESGEDVVAMLPLNS